MKKKKIMEKPIEDRPNWRWRMKSALAPDVTFIRVIQQTWRCSREEAVHEFARCCDAGIIIPAGAVGTMKDVIVYRISKI